MAQNNASAPGGQAKRSSKRRKKWNGVRFVTIDHPVLDSAAFAALSGEAAKALLLLLRRWNGPANNNNGKLPLSVRDIKAYCHVRSERACDVTRELAASGLAVPVQKGAFSWKARHATTWRIAFLPTATEPADWSFVRRQNLKVGSRSGNRAVPAVGTDEPTAAPKMAQSVPAVGTAGAVLGSRSGNTSKVPYESALKAQRKNLVVVAGRKPPYQQQRNGQLQEMAVENSGFLRKTLP